MEGKAKIKGKSQKEKVKKIWVMIARPSPLA